MENVPFAHHILLMLQNHHNIFKNSTEARVTSLFFSKWGEKPTDVHDLYSVPADTFASLDTGDRLGCKYVILSLSHSTEGSQKSAFAILAPFFVLLELMNIPHAEI